MRQGRARKNSGQAVVEGTAAVVALITVFVLSLLLLLGTGMVLNYKQKLALAADSGARYATETIEWLGARRCSMTEDELAVEVKKNVNATLEHMGLPAAQVTLSEPKLINSKKYYVVTVTNSSLPIISGGVLPATITLSETACSCVPNTKPPAVLGLTWLDAGRGQYIPCYGAGLNDPGPKTYPRKNFAYYGNSIGHGAYAGPFQDNCGGGPWVDRP